MKNLILLLGALIPGISLAQQYAMDWSTIDGGGGTSTGGVYTLSGTIGQPDAGPMTGGNYTLHGGFWGVIAAVQTPRAPLLAIWRTTTNTVLISWPYPSTGLALQQNPSLGSANWTSVTNAPVQTGDQWQVIILPPTGNRFYRLRNPQTRVMRLSLQIDPAPSRSVTWTSCA